jgi:hypothetical protein
LLVPNARAEVFDFKNRFAHFCMGKNK